MATIHIIILVITGATAGFAGSLLGLGGGFLMTPVQYMVYISMGIPADTAIKMAVATSLLVIFPTSISGAWRHHSKGAVLWKAAIILGGGGVIGSFIGATLATYLPGSVLKVAFGIVVLGSALRMFTARLPQTEDVPKSNPWLWVALALPIGMISGLVGIGGGLVAIPVMTMFLKFKMHNAVATSLAAMILTSAGGVIGYIVNGIGASGLPGYSIGYINLQSGFLLAVASIGMAQVGAITAHRLPARQIKLIFVIIMLYMGLRMLGLFELLGLPL